MSGDDATRLGRRSPLIKAKVKLTDPPREAGLVERTTLFLVSLKKRDVLGLLDGFTSEARQRARLYAQRLADLDSPTRQARLALEFGVGEDARPRLEQLLAESPPALKAAIAAQLPLSWRRPSDVGTGTRASPALMALAARLVREASRR